MRDKEEVRKEVAHIPTHQETVAKFFEEHENLESIIAWVKASFEGGHPDAAKIFLREAEESISTLGQGDCLPLAGRGIALSPFFDTVDS